MHQSEYSIPTRINSFNATVEVMFKVDLKGLNEWQTKNYDYFKTHQDLLISKVLEKIFDLYKESYEDNYKAWVRETDMPRKKLEKFLPVPSNPIALKKNLQLLSVWVTDQGNSQQNSLEFYFDCTWHLFGLLAVIVKDNEVVQAGF